jgi:hypothetical protein
MIADDLDGSPGAETVAFSFGGQGYEIDLSASNRAAMEKALQPFIAAGHRAAQRSRPAPASRAAASGADRAAVRAWAAEQGLRISDRGRISAEVMSKYEASH